MATRNCLSSISSTAESSSSTAKSTTVSENRSKVMAAKPPSAKKRPALADITNRKNASRVVPRVSQPQSKAMVPCSAKIVKKKTSKQSPNQGETEDTLPASTSAKPDMLVPYGPVLLHMDQSLSTLVSVGQSPSCSESASLHQGTTVSGAREAYLSPRSIGASVSLDGSMSSCDSLKSLEFEHIGREDAPEVKSAEKKETNVLHISQQADCGGEIRKENELAKKEPIHDAFSVDNDFANPQFCAAIVSDIYNHLQASEIKKRPSSNYMERVQRDITSSMRAILIDWLVEVAEEYRLLPETLYLAANYIDRYLSSSTLSKHQLQLLGVACMMIAAKFEEICVPLVQEFCYVTDNTYSKVEVQWMESMVLNNLNFEMAAPTAKCFLRLFVYVAQKDNEVPSVKFECLANYITELSLVEYRMLRYAASLIAASATFLAKFILSPSKKPWSSVMESYTHYRPSDLSECVKSLHRLCLTSSQPNLPAVREKYSQHKYKFVAKKYCPMTIPPEYFED